MTDVWESAWDRLSESFGRVASSLNSSCPDMTWSARHSDNKAFPFRAYATFNRGWPESVDVVASVDFRRQSNDELRFSADIGFDDGEVLIDGPSGSVDVASGCLLHAEKSIRPL
jgi:hypothetical protein